MTSKQQLFCDDILPVSLLDLLELSELRLTQSHRFCGAINTPTPIFWGKPLVTDYSSATIRFEFV